MPESPSDAPAPEVLQPQADADETPADTPAPASPSGTKPPEQLKKRRITYRPSHKATFIGLGVVVGILLINAAVFAFLMRGQTDDSQTQRDEVIISTEELEKLGVNKSQVGNLGTELIVGPDTRFNGKVTIASDTNISGQVNVNGSLRTTNASVTKLQAGDVTMETLNLNGSLTATSLSLRNDLNVVGATKLQGAVSVNNNMNVIGNLTVGGSIFAGSFQASNLISGSTLTIGGHVIVRGAPPTVSAGPSVGSNGTVSISGTDTSGTVAVNIGTGGGAGIVANVVFNKAYDSTPHVVISAVGRSAGSIYVTRTATGFSIGVASALAPGGYAFDFVVMQ